MRPLIIFSVLIILPLYGWNQNAYTVESIPDPKKTDNTYVSNPDHIINENVVSDLNALLRELEDTTTVQVAVVVVNSIGDEVPEEFRYQLFKYWHIGQKQNDNGLLILMVMDQHRIEFETGYGLEGILTDAMCKQIQMEYMVPLAKEGKYGECLFAGVQQVIHILMDPNYREEVYATSIENYEYLPWWRKKTPAPMLAFFGSVYGLIALISLYSKKKNIKKAPVYVKNHFSGTYSALKFSLLNIGLPAGFYIWQQATGSVRVFEFWLFAYALFSILLFEKRLRLNHFIFADTKNSDPQETYNLLSKSHSKGWITASIFFPVPFILYSIFNSGRMKRMRNSPPLTDDGKREMQRLNDFDEDAFLQTYQLTEEKIKSVDYDVWKDPASEHVKIFRFENYYSKYQVCPKCKSKAYRMIKNETLVSATYDSSGTGRKTYQCSACNYRNSTTYTIAELTRSSSGSGGGGFSGGGGGSFGGGSSGGGGAGSSW